MNIQITAYGLGSGHDESAGGSYDDTQIKKELEAVKKQLSNLPKGGAAYDDTDLRKQIAAVAEQVSKIADTRKEYQAAYVPKKDLGSDIDLEGFATVKFKKPFSKIPFIKTTFDIKKRSVGDIYIANVTETGFEISTQTSSDLSKLDGVWYEAHLID
nr:MAG TPA: H-type lectin domain [Caudoviricetes sp.]